MARIRTIKPGFFTSLTVASLPLSARLTFIGLWTYCDDSGRGRDDPRLIKAALWPLDDAHGLRRVETDLAALEKKGLLERYVHDGQQYLRIRSWDEHQRINRPSPSLLPPSPEESLRPPGALTEPSPPEGKGKERNSPSSPPPTSSEPQPGKAAAPPDDGDGTNPENPSPPPWRTDPLVQRWVAEVTHNDTPHHAMEVWRIVEHLRGFVDDLVIDEAIGVCAAHDGEITRPKYLLTTVTNSAALQGIKVPPPARAGK